MFKSVFAKYIMAFMLIILFSFSVIVVIIASIITQYSEQTKTDMIENAGQTSSAYLESKLSDANRSDLKELLATEYNDVERVMTVISSNADGMTVLLVDPDGAILLAAGSKKDAVTSDETILPSMMEELKQDISFMESGILIEILDSEHAVYAVPLHNDTGAVCGSVWICASSVMLNELLKLIIKAVVVAILWVLLASMIAIYFISERVISPLKEISRAAKRFASGKFDTRVTVRGSDEVAELAVAFNNMAENLDNYDAMRNTFMSNVSHDLRSPMTSISGFIDGILDGVIPPEKHRYYLQIVSSEIQRLSRLVSSLLDLSRIQAGERKFTIHPFDVCEMGREILISFEQKINRKGLEVEFQCPEDHMVVLADRDAIYQVLYNLCDNAIKFAADGGLFRMKFQKLKNRKILVSIYNEGQGISSNDLPYVFERFYKSDKSRGLNKTGAGLGLFISKTIMDAHHEEIWAESEFGKNCCFYFTLAGE